MALCILLRYKCTAKGEREHYHFSPSEMNNRIFLFIFASPRLFGCVFARSRLESTTTKSTTVSKNNLCHSEEGQLKKKVLVQSRVCSSYLLSRNEGHSVPRHIASVSFVLLLLVPFGSDSLGIGNIMNLKGWKSG